MIRVQRVYEATTEGGGVRFLVDRLWPRGVRREALHLDAWLKDVAPSNALRQWFGHEPAKWGEFQRRYAAELEGKPDAWRPIVEAAHTGDVILLYGARDTEHNQAVALKAFLEDRLKSR